MSEQDDAAPPSSPPLAWLSPGGGAPKPRAARPTVAVPTGLSPDDPVYAIVREVEAMHARTLADIGALVTRLSDDVAASAVVAETAAKARGESLVTNAGAWASEQIRAAGREIVVQIQDQHDMSERLIEQFLDKLWLYLLVVSTIAGFATGGVVLFLLNILPM